MSPKEMSDEVRVGHWTSPEGDTGCTVVLLPADNTASGEVRGGAPATREFELLDPRRLVQAVDAVVLTGGSAFGLASATGVVDYLFGNGQGYPTSAGPVPIVVALALFDLAEGRARPAAEHGRLAASSARADFVTGRVGAGAGATVDKWLRPGAPTPSGLRYFRATAGAVAVHALVAVNALGEIDEGSTEAVIASGDFIPPGKPSAFENTTIGVIWTNATLDKIGCRLVAESGHDGFGRALVPAHTIYDGDALVAVALNRVEADLTTVRALATVAIERAVRDVSCL